MLCCTIQHCTIDWMLWSVAINAFRKMHCLLSLLCPHKILSVFSLIKVADFYSYVGKKQELLLHRACTYILAHYMEPDLDRNRIATALGCSTRSLSRAFEGGGIKLHGYIRVLRLHKGRELLRRKPNLTIEKIANRLHFSSARHF